jgi:hypothetical protein
MEMIGLYKIRSNFLVVWDGSKLVDPCHFTAEEAGRVSIHEFYVTNWIKYYLFLYLLLNERGY